MGRKTNLGSQGVNARGGSVPIVSRIRFYKGVTILFVALLLTIVLTVRSTYSEQRCQNMPPSIKIINESGGERLSGDPSTNTTQEVPFKNYVKAISKHISSKIQAQCQGNIKGAPEVELFFVFRPLTITKSIPSEVPFDFKHARSASTKYLDSPWVKLTMNQSPKSLVRGVFLWSERQFLLDQAQMSGMQASSPKTLPAIERHVFLQFVDDYTKTVLGVPSRDARPAAQAAISKRLPPEILWLFRNAWQSTLASFSTQVNDALEKTTQRSVVGYTKLTETLVDQFFTSAKTKICYESVLDLKDVSTLNQYRVNQIR